MNKKITAIIIAFLLCICAWGIPTERIYVSTDRSVYLAGDNIWCSLFLVDASTLQLSSFSAIAYMELLSTDGYITSAKISLTEGRGAGRFRIPYNTPSGNYRLVAYTAQNTNEPDSWMAGSRIISIFI